MAKQMELWPGLGYKLRWERKSAEHRRYMSALCVIPGCGKKAVVNLPEFLCDDHAPPIGEEWEEWKQASCG